MNPRVFGGPVSHINYTIPDHAAASADLLRLYAKRIAQGENPADWPEFPLVMRVIGRRI